MYVKMRKDGAEQAIVLLSVDPHGNQSHCHSAWLLLKVLGCMLFFLMLAFSLVLCVVYRHQYGEHDVQYAQTEEYTKDQHRGLDGLVTKQPQSADAVVVPGNVEMLISQTRILPPNSAVFDRISISKKSRRNSRAHSRAKMSSFSRIVEDLLGEDLLKLHQKILCLDAYADKEVVALKERGFTNAQGINLLPALLNPKHMHENTQLKKLSDQNFDFFFTSMFDRIPDPALFVAEIERTLKVGGLAAMHVSLNKWRNRYITGEPGRGIKPVTLLFQHSEIVYVSSADAPGLDTIIVFKKTTLGKTTQVDRKEMNRKQLHDSPSTPQSVMNSVKLRSEPKCRKYSKVQQLEHRKYMAKLWGTGSQLYTIVRDAFLPSAAHFRGEVGMKKPMPTVLPGASNLNALFVQGLSNVAQSNGVTVEDNMHPKAFIYDGQASLEDEDSSTEVGGVHQVGQRLCK